MTGRLKLNKDEFDDFLLSRRMTIDHEEAEKEMARIGEKKSG